MLPRPMIWKGWRSRKDGNLFIVAPDGRFDDLPVLIRHLGPWSCVREGEVERLRPAYRFLIEAQGFALVYAELKAFNPDA